MSEIRKWVEENGMPGSTAVTMAKAFEESEACLETCAGQINGIIRDVFVSLMDHFDLSSKHSKRWIDSIAASGQMEEWDRRIRIALVEAMANHGDVLLDISKRTWDELRSGDEQK